MPPGMFVFDGVIPFIDEISAPAQIDNAPDYEAVNGDACFNFDVSIWLKSAV